ncbi:MAG TPA: DUF1775 domain-containing protein [Solirubrobacterales bacterium]|nr:DUF1775 domain-containing protein [Solirubrobacterales bacterium]
MSKLNIRHLGLAAAVVAATALLLVPTGAGGHAAVSPSHPQTTPLTAARTSYVLRVPNEKATQNTYKVTLFVPAALQEVISVKQLGDWSVRLKRRDTGKKNDEGEPVYAVTSISWIAKQGSEIRPHFFGEFFIRFQNPVQPGQFCFPTNQYYRPKGFDRLSKRQKRSAKPELVAWAGKPDAEFPASCITTTAAAPTGH